METVPTILIVDDDPIIRANLERLLTRRGYGAETASTAEEALVMLAQRRYDLIVTDLQMPGMDGLELLGKIKERSANTPVVMLTAFATTEVVIQALRGGADDFVPKPYEPEELLNIVKRELARHKQAAPAGMGESLGMMLSREQLDEVDILLAQLRAEVAARCILLIEGNGYVIGAKGAIEDLNVSALAALVAGDFAAASSIAALIGEEKSFRLNYHEGENYHVYSAQVVPDAFLLIIFGHEVRLGSVLHFAGKFVPQLREILESAAAAPTPVEMGDLLGPFDPSTVELPGWEAPPAEQTAPAEEKKSFTLEEIKASGLLDEDALANLERQFQSMWIS